MKKLLVLALVLSFAALASADIVAHWALDGTTVDSKGSADGTLTGATWTTGLIGQALDFSSADTDRVDLDVAAINNNISKDGAMSFSVWVRGQNAVNPESMYVFATYSAAAAGRKIALRAPFYGGGHEYAFFNAFGYAGQGEDEVGNNTMDGSTIWNDDAWHHYAMTKDTATDTMAIYIDGQLSQSLGNKTAQLFVDNVSFILGGSATNIQGMDGLIDDFAILDTALTANQVASIYISGLAGNTIPEPATMALLGLGGLALIRRKK